jgi:regulator of cell morphogenesis and NO signaling
MFRRNRRIIPVLTELQSGYERALIDGEDINQFRYENPIMLMDYIIHWHHERLRENLPALEKLLAKIVDVHGINHPELYEVEKVFTSLETCHERSFGRRRRSLFPLIKEAAETGALTEAVIKAVPFSAS